MAVALKEADTAEFRAYAQAIVDNAKALGQALVERGFGVVSGGTDNHLLLVDMTNKGVTGNQMSKALDAAGIVCNYNLVPGDPRSARRPSGIRLGTPSITSRGFGGDQMIQLADWMDEIAQIRADESIDRDARREAYRRVAGEVRDLCDRFPAPGLDIA
ncbi:uncharacterized protein METZ01_LOCUS434017 [marine metagenome]|uniref:Serine hydroxymethyltransferase-like domain-containing protein n=1 Tax=marine metagenome TaxID=408172 RepID=A0A382YD10_9ZZZZ